MVTVKNGTGKTGMMRKITIEKKSGIARKTIMVITANPSSKASLL